MRKHLLPKIIIILFILCLGVGIFVFSHAQGFSYLSEGLGKSPTHIAVDKKYGLCDVSREGGALNPLSVVRRPRSLTHFSVVAQKNF